MQLLIKDLPQSLTGEENPVLRHFIVLDDGRIFFQDEMLQNNAGDIVSVRKDWQQLPTPPSAALVVGTFEYGGLPGAILSDGKAYLWTVVSPKDQEEEYELQVLSMSHRIHEWPHAWFPFHEPVPGTPAYNEYNR